MKISAPFVVWVLKFCQLLLSKICKDVSTPSTDDLTKAKTLWIIEARKMLLKDKKFPQWRRQFDLFQDNDKVWAGVGFKMLVSPSQQSTPSCYTKPTS